MSDVVEKKPVLTVAPVSPVAPLVPVASTVTVAATAAAPLDELMLAMDVVDTLRHRELMLEREVESGDRDERLLVRLREIYSAQGIAVTDDVLAQGVSALREDRFVYTPPTPSFGRSLATLYVKRARWGKWLVAAIVIIAGAVVAQTLHNVWESSAAAALPGDLQGAYQAVVSTTHDQKALGQAQEALAAGRAALALHDPRAAGVAVGELRGLEARLEQQYELRIVSRPGEWSYMWRYPKTREAEKEDPSAQNYYVIVEAIPPSGVPLALPIRSEEDGTTTRVRQWGLRVDEATYNKVKADKEDHGIVEQSLVGSKRRGELDPQYTVATTGAAITKW